MDTISFSINEKGVSSLELVGMKLMRLDEGRQLEMGNLEHR